MRAIKAAASRSPHNEHQVALEEHVFLFPLLCASSSSSAYAPVGHTRSETLQHCIIPIIPQFLLYLSLGRSTDADPQFLLQITSVREKSKKVVFLEGSGEEDKM